MKQRVPSRLERKENAVKNILLCSSTTTYPLTTDNLDLIFKDKIHELAQINIEINIYDLDEIFKIIKGIVLSKFLPYS
jgi:hypothetical protein